MRLEWATYYGGSGDEGGETHNLGVGPGDSAYIAMFSNCGALPGALNNNPGAGNGFVARIASDGGSVLGARYIGTSSYDEAEGIEVRNGFVAVGGGTDSTQFPVTNDAFQGTRVGGIDAWVAVFPLDLSSQVYGSYIGTSGFDFTHGVAWAPDGTLAVVGQAGADDLPVVLAFESVLNPQIPVSNGGDQQQLGRRLCRAAALISTRRARPQARSHRG